MQRVLFIITRQNMLKSRENGDIMHELEEYGIMNNSDTQISEFNSSLESGEKDCPTKVFPADSGCPVCGEELYKSGRCTTCYSCGWSTCSI
jgi:hypothetical protein